jgi:hypothetical protein
MVLGRRAPEWRERLNPAAPKVPPDFGCVEFAERPVFAPFKAVGDTIILALLSKTYVIRLLPYHTIEQHISSMGEWLNTVVPYLLEEQE